MKITASANTTVPVFSTHDLRHTAPPGLYRYHAPTGGPYVLVVPRMSGAGTGAKNLTVFLDPGSSKAEELVGDGMWVPHTGSLTLSS